MVKQVNKINKAKYSTNNKSTIVIIAGIAIALIIGIATFWGSDAPTNSAAGPAPSGSNCQENVAYLQLGVDKYKELTGQVVTDVNQLTQKVGDKGPFVEKVPACPSGNIYVINNGVVAEAPKQ